MELCNNYELNHELLPLSYLTAYRRTTTCSSDNMYIITSPDIIMLELKVWTNCKFKLAPCDLFSHSAPYL